MAYAIEQVSPLDRRTNRLVDELLQQEGILRDKNLDYTCAMTDEDYNVIATGSCFGNTLRCFAVDHHHQGEGLMNEIISHLIEVQMSRGNVHLFVYTKISTAKFFQDLGFSEIARTAQSVAFLENRRNAFPSYLNQLEQETPEEFRGKKAAAIVMNANPFTKGHQYLVETAAASADVLHLFVVSEDASDFPFGVRWKLVQEGTAHLKNVVMHKTGPYLISSATFPSYFLKDEAAVNRGHGELDAAVFGRIAEKLGISDRYVGEEPTSQVTAIYNEALQAVLPSLGVACHVIPRKKEEERVISASTVRQCLKDGNWDVLREMLPASTLAFLESEEAEPVIRGIKAKESVVHY